MRSSLPAQSSPSGAALTEGVLATCLTLPYTIAYAIVVNQVDPLVCQGIPMSFGFFAKWSYIILIVINVIFIPLSYFVAKQRDAGEASSLDQPLRIFKVLRALYLLVIWVYACVALANRDTCGSRGLVNLIWVTVIIPVATICLVCCCFWAIVIVAGTAVATASQQTRLNNSGIGATENVELRELRRALQERQRDLESSQNRGQPINY